MITENNKWENFKMQYPLERIAPLEKILFLDIETTGFTAKNSYLYLIGAAYYTNGCWYIKQWFADCYDDEKWLLISFFSFAANYTHLIHFNGNNFDLPYLLQKAAQYGLEYNFESFEGIDLYRRISPYKFFLNIPNCKQKTMESFLDIERKDRFDGGELITVYHNYVKQSTKYNNNELLLHNYEDMKGMLQLTSMLAYYDLFNEKPRAKKVQANSYKDYHGKNQNVLLMNLELPTAIPRQLSTFLNGCSFIGEGSEGRLKVTIYDEEMKYFYSNYKDYYYLPLEDMAIHKSVASFVDKSHRTQATAATCYTRKVSSYLPEWDVFIEPFFKRDYASKELFFELTEERKKDRALFSEYAAHVLNKMANTY